MFNFKQYDFKKYNITLIILVVTLCAIGVFLMHCIDDPDTNSKMKKQLMGIILGIFLAAIVSIIDYHFICAMAIPLYIISLIMLALVEFTPLGVHHLGATRWLNLYFVELQPSELTKVILIICYAVFLNKFKDKMNKFSTLCLAILIVIPPLALILKQPHLSTSIIILLVAATMIFVGGLSFKIILPIFAVGIPLAAGLLWYLVQPFQTLITPVQQGRILGFLNQEESAQDVMYQQLRSVEAIGSGQLYGKLFSENSDAIRGSKLVTQNESDFIFAVIGEEFGFIGGCIVIGLLMLVIIQCFMVAVRARDFTGKMLTIGITSMLMYQIFINIGVATKLLPNTGQPLPFISSGITTLICCMSGIGIILNIGLQRKNTRG